MLDDSSILEPCSAAYLISLLETIGPESSEEPAEVAGRRKGSEPVGEAWLFEEIRR